MEAAAQIKRGIRVFLVEDSAVVRERLQSLLGSIEGAHAVGECGDARRAVGDILLAQPDVVVLDLKLGGGTGFDVLRELHARAPEIDVYMLTNFVSEPYRRLAERLGARAFFDKSSEFERVREAIVARARQLH